MPRLRLVALLLGLATLLVYLPVRSNGFVYDDHDYVVNNRTVQRGLTLDGLRLAFTTTHSANWHPLTWISHMVDCQLFGMTPGPQHLVNVLFHAANAVLLLLLLFRLTGALWPSAFVAALFAWHPLHVESVAWISERKDVLSTFFGLMALMAYSNYAMPRTAGSSERRRHSYCLALVLFGCALLAKSMLVTLPLLLLLLDFWPLRRFSSVRMLVSNKGQFILEKAPFLLLSAGSCIATVLAQKQGDAMSTFGQVPLEVRLQNIPVAYLLYVLKTFWPTNLAVFYPLPQQVPLLAVVGSLAVLVVVSVAFWISRQSKPYLLVGWLWFLGTLVPVIGIVQVGSQQLADRYTYFPLIGIFVAVAFGAGDLARSVNLPAFVTATAASVLALGSIALTEAQLRFWRDDKTLFLHDLSVTTNNPVAHHWVGQAFQDEGALDRALTEYREAERLFPDYLFPHYFIGGVLSAMGRREEALAEYRQAAQLKPNVPAVHDRIGIVLFELHRDDEAVAELRLAAKLEPGYPWPHFHLAKLLAGQGKDAAAVAEFQEALRIEPDNVQALTYAAQILSASEDARVRNGTTAVEYALRANRLTQGSQLSVLDTLGMAYAETGRFEEAKDAAQNALAIAVANNINDTDALRRRLELYTNRSPWRQSFR
jgi:tetratricopeptide (TPR) repeat protein